MFAYLLNPNFEVIKLVDSFESFIWTDRYKEAGDFEIYAEPSIDIITNFRLNYYLFNPESDHVMIIESNEISSDSEDGNRIIISGRSLESMLTRRVVIETITIDDTLQNGLKKLFNDAIISPTNPDRKIANFVFKESTDPRITKLKLSAQFKHETLYDIVTKQCEINDIGFKIELNEKNEFVFSLYKGADRSYAQIENPHITFSPSFQNIAESSYTEDNSGFSNVAVVGGKTDTYGEIIHEVGKSSGLSRREVYTDASSISDKREDESIISKDEYIKLLDAQGVIDLDEHKIETIFDGQAEPKNNYIYGKDYFIGDVVEIANEYGINGQSIISEMIWSHDKEGITSYPTFISHEQLKALIKDHDSLINRDLKDQHPMTAITGLIDALKSRTEVSEFVWNEEQIISVTDIPTTFAVSYAGVDDYGNDHAKLNKRDAADQHPMNAISGLINAVNSKASLSVFEWNGNDTFIFGPQLSYAPVEEAKDHTGLFNRDIDEQHPISAITGLTEVLDTKAGISNFEWNS